MRAREKGAWNGVLHMLKEEPEKGAVGALCEEGQHNAVVVKSISRNLSGKLIG